MKPKITATYRTGEELRARPMGMCMNGWIVVHDKGKYVTDDWRDAVAFAMATYAWEELHPGTCRIHQYQHVGFRCPWPIPMRLGVTLIDAGQTGEVRDD